MKTYAEYVNTIAEVFADYLKHDYDPETGESNIDFLQDVMHEVVDGSVPVYTSEIFDLASDPNVYGQDPSELGCEGESLDKQVIACIYLAGYQELGEMIHRPEIYFPEVVEMVGGVERFEELYEL